jgi:ATP-dependent Clp protease protease subunit
MDFYSEFKGYALKHMGISSIDFNAWEKTQNTIYGNTMVSNNMTPMVPEERETRVTLMSVFDRMMMDRILWVIGPVNSQMSTVVSAQLMFLENLDSKADITMQISSPGGSVLEGLTIVDTMNYIEPDIRTVNMGMAASMGSVLLASGTKGKRCGLPNSRVMIHQVSFGFSGVITDSRISVEQAERYNTKLFKILGDACGKKPEQVIKDADRDNWLDADEAKAYGLIEEIIYKK